MTNQLSTIQRVRAKYPTPLGAQHPTFLIEAAQATGAKLLRKDAGTHVTLPNGINVSQDILMFLDQGVDILSDGEGTAIPTWQEKGTIAGEYIDVSGLSVPGTPPPTTPPPSQPPAHDYGPELAALQREIDSIKARLAALPSSPDLSQYAKKGDPVTVSGKTITYGLRSNDATWSGSINR